MQQLEDDQRVMQTEVMRSGDTGCNLPVNLKRLIENAQRKFGCRPHKRGFTGGWPGGPAGRGHREQAQLNSSRQHMAAVPC